MTKLLAATLIMTITFAVAPSLQAQRANENPAQQINRNPEAAQIITSYIDNYWTAYVFAPGAKS